MDFALGEVPGLGKLWQWSLLLPFSYADRVFFLIGVVPMLFFYCYGAVLFAIDFVASEEFIHKYKVQNTSRPTKEQYWAALKTSIFNWAVLGLPYMYLLAHYVMPTEAPSIPSVAIFVRDLLVYIIVEEVLFFLTHRAVHHPVLYAPIHKFHHTYTAPFGIAAIYAHPIEHLLANVMPVSMGPILLQSHPLVPMLWGVLALFNTMTVHSGYDFTSFIIFPPPYFHDWHHEKFTENFGTSLFMDKLFGTSTGFEAAITRGEVFVPRSKKSKKYQ